MSGTNVDWLPALIVLALGLVAGGLVLWRLRGRLSPTPAAEEGYATLTDLEVRRDTLINELRELVDTGAKRTAAQLAEERYALELEAARVLREIESERARTVRAAAAALASTPAAAPAGSSTLKGFLWGVGSITALGLLLFFASRSTEQRSGAPSGMAPANTGGLPGAGDDAEIERLKAVIAARPDDLEARVQLAAAYLQRNEMMPVFEQTRAVLQREPENPRALTYQAVVRLAMGQAPQAESMLKRALAAAPTLTDAHIYLMLVYTETGRDQDAEVALAAATKRLPDHAEALRGLLKQMREELAARRVAEADATMAGGENPHAEGGPAADPHAGLDQGVTGAPSALPPRHPPVAPMAAAQPPMAAAATTATATTTTTTTASGGSVAGTLEPDATARGKVPPGATIYLMLRPAGSPSGAPLAVKRMAAAASFPMPFEIGVADSMTGAPIPERLVVEARVDADGDAATRTPQDPLGRVDGVASGARNVRLVLSVPR